MVGELGMVSVGGGDQAGEDRGLVTRTGVSHSDVSGRTWARVTGAVCPEARSVETRRPVTREASDQRGQCHQQRVTVSRDRPAIKLHWWKRNKLTHTRAG